MGNGDAYQARHYCIRPRLGVGRYVRAPDGQLLCARLSATTNRHGTGRCASIYPSTPLQTETAGLSVRDVYSAPTLKFRINRKAVGIDYEYDDVNVRWS